jgi:hypothetical protein
MRMLPPCLSRPAAIGRTGQAYWLSRQGTARFGRFFWAMMDRGVYLPCSQFEAAFLSAANTPEHIHWPRPARSCPRLHDLMSGRHRHPGGRAG